jgi:hypothetical protein
MRYGGLRSSTLRSASVCGESDEAVEILLENDDLGPAIRNQHLTPYRPMPPLIDAELPDGRVERTVAVGLLPREAGRGTRSSARTWSTGP